MKQKKVKNETLTYAKTLKNMYEMGFNDALSLCEHYTAKEVRRVHEKIKKTK